jgi:hypothetical protein
MSRRSSAASDSARPGTAGNNSAGSTPQDGGEIEQVVQSGHLDAAFPKADHRRPPTPEVDGQLLLAQPGTPPGLSQHDHELGQPLLAGHRFA